MNNLNENISSIAASINVPISLNRHRNQLTATIDKEDLIQFANELKNNSDTSFDMLIDITAIDWLRAVNRFEIIYFLYSNKFKNRLRLKFGIDEKRPVCASIISVWESADWYERETYDM